MLLFIPLLGHTSSSLACTPAVCPFIQSRKMYVQSVQAAAACACPNHLHCPALKASSATRNGDMTTGSELCEGSVLAAFTEFLLENRTFAGPPDAAER